MTHLSSDNSLFTLTCMTRPRKKAPIICMESVEAPHSARARTHARWSTRLKALLKSMDSSDTADSGSSRDQRILSQQSISKWFVPLPFTPPNWLGLILTSSHNFSSTKDSNIFESELGHERFLSWSNVEASSPLGITVCVSVSQSRGHIFFCKE